MPLQLQSLRRMLEEGPKPSMRRFMGVAAGQTISLKGTASDNLGIRAVRWYDERGRQGVARLTWNFSGDASSGWDGEMSWSVDNLRVPRGTRRITISAEDIKGLAEELSLEVTP